MRCPCPAGGAARDLRAVADGLLLAHGRRPRRWRRPCGTAEDVAPTRGAADLGTGQPADLRRPCFAAHLERWSPVRCRRCALRTASPRQLRGPGRGGTRGCLRPRRRRPLPDFARAAWGTDRDRPAADDCSTHVRHRSWGHDGTDYASRFHAALEPRNLPGACRCRAPHRCETVVLAGGVFQNRRMLESVSLGAASFGLRVLIPERLPIGDGGVSYSGRPRSPPGESPGRPSRSHQRVRRSRTTAGAHAVFICGVHRPFGELTPEDASARAAELREVSGWGPTMRVRPVALAWRELASEMERAGVVTVSQLDPQLLAPLAPGARGC